MRSQTKGRAPTDAPTFLRLTTEERVRFKVACAENRCTYAEFVMAAVEAHEQRTVAEAAVAASPLHVR